LPTLAHAVLFWPLSPASYTLLQILCAWWVYHFSSHHQPEPDSGSDTQEDRGWKENIRSGFGEISLVSFPSENIQIANACMVGPIYIRLLLFTTGYIFTALYLKRYRQLIEPTHGNTEQVINAIQKMEWSEDVWRWCLCYLAFSLWKNRSQYSQNENYLQLWEFTIDDDFLLTKKSTLELKCIEDHENECPFGLLWVSAIINGFWATH
jgi:hypothetical protein